MMKFRAMLVFSAACGLLVGQLCAAEGSAEKGQAKSAPCAACHGADGNSVNPEWPSLAGQHVAYINKQLHAFKSGSRTNPLMTPMAQPLSDEDIEDLAAYFSKQVRRGGETEPSKVSLGQRIYRGGDNNSGVPACMACHGPRGAGNPTALYPSIAGQQATYVVNQLKAYRAGTRQTDQNQMMRNVAASMTDEQIDAVASYVQGLR
jgi:cytochrome c553